MNIVRMATVIGLLASAGCGSTDPEMAIRASLAEAEQAAEARDTGFFGDLIGPAYRDSRGNDRAQVIAMVRGLFIGNQRVEIVSRVDEVVLEGDDAARAVVYAGMLGQRAGAVALGGVTADWYRFELELVNDGGQWQIIGATWSRTLGE